MEFAKENWKKLIKERFIELRKKIENTRLKYINNSSSTTINERLEYNNQEDDHFTDLYKESTDATFIQCELPQDNDVIDSNEDSSDNINVTRDPPEINIYTDLYQQMKNLEKKFSDEDQKKTISAEIDESFAHLLLRTLHKIEMYFIDHDRDINKFYDDIVYVKKIIIKRQKQLQRLFYTNALSKYDYQVLKYETILRQRTNEFNLFTNEIQSFASLKKQRKALDLAFNHFDIPLDNPQIICQKISYSKYKKSTYFITSEKVDNSFTIRETDFTYIDLIKSIRNDRWVVLLGSAGSGKTTFARWLICQFTRALFIEQKNVIIFDIDMGPARIPILIRIGEFSQWLESHPDSTLLDYIGQHTWFGQLYASDSLEILKDFVRYGHALIIFDGLDEVATLELHNRVVTSVHLFMQTHCISHEFVSPFDDIYVANAGLRTSFRREGLSGKNLVLITSRILNYTSHPFNGELISHYTIQSMSDEYLHSFVEHWCFHVQNEINHLLIKNISELKENKMKCHSNLKPKTLITKIESDNGLKSLASNPSVLSIICSLFALYGSDALEKTRVQLYQKVVELMLRRWENHQSSIPEDALISIFSNMAFYIHSHSGSGLIDEFDLAHLCRLSLKQWYDKQPNLMHYGSLKIRQQTEQFMQLLSEDAGIVAARALCIYGFLHSVFQEYFVCLALVKINDSNAKMSIRELVNRFLSLFSNIRFQESLNLAIGWISLHWSIEDYEEFCIELQSKANLSNKHIPIGSLWFVNALNDLGCLPSSSIVHSVLNTLLDAYEHRNIYTFKVKLMTALDQLPAALVNSWLDQLFVKENSINALRMLYLLYNAVSNRAGPPRWLTSISCEILWKKIGLLSEEIDIYIDRILTILGATICDRLPTPPGSMRDYLLSRAISTPEMHSSVLAALIALYGGLELNRSKTKRQISVVFAARRMHRDSPLSPLFIEYMNDAITERRTKLKRLTDKCEQILAIATSTNITQQIIHSLVVLFCIYSIDQSSNYEQYIGSEVWQAAIRHMKMVVLYLHEILCINPGSKFKNNLTDIIEEFLVNSREDILDTAQSFSHAFCRLLCARKSFFFPDVSRDGWNNVIVIKMPPTIQLSSITDLNDDELVKLLPFVCSVGLRQTVDLVIEELEAEDLVLLKNGIHPFQLLQNKPIILLLAYVPSSLQRLYIKLFAQNQISIDETSILPFLHLLIEFLCVALTMQKYSIRFCVLFTILLPTIVQYRMENFIHMFTQISWRDEDRHFFKAYKDSRFLHFASIMRVGDGAEEERFKEKTMAEEQRRIINAQTDLHLYAACSCVARLAQKSYAWISSEKNFNDLWTIVQAIQHPIWRLDASINICCIFFSDRKDEQLKNLPKDRYRALMTSLKEIEPTTPLLTYVALFVRCMTFIHEDFQLEKGLIHNILQRLKTVTISEQQAIYEALTSFRSFRCTIVQHVHQSEFSENTVKLNQIFRCTSTTFLKHLSTKFFSTSDMMGIHSTLLANMYLFELNSYVKFLDYSSIKETHYYTTDNLMSQSLAQKCLRTLEQEPIQSLTFEAASMITSLLSSSIEETETIEVIRIKQSLMKKTCIQESAYSFVFEWLNYWYDKRLCSFAYQSALLLGLSNMWSPTIIEMCCELLNNECDNYRETASKLINDGKWHTEKQSINIFISCLGRWNKEKLKWLTHIEGLFKQFDIQVINEMDQILQLERQRFQKTIRNKSVISDTVNEHDYEVSYFRLIKNLSSEVQEYIVHAMRSWAKCLPDSTEILFLQWLLKNISCKLFEGHENFIKSLIEILLDSTHVELKITVAKALGFFRENKQVRTVLWNVVVNNKQDLNELIAVCIWSLFRNRKDDHFGQKKLKELDQLREYAHSSIVRQAALDAMYFHITTEPEKYNVIEVYRAYMTNASYRTRDSYNNGDMVASRWIIQHAAILLPQFTDDMYKSFYNVSIFDDPPYMQVAEIICKEIPNEFRNSVRQSSIGETAFRKGVYEKSRRVCARALTTYLYVYACFEQVTYDCVTMIIEGALKTSAWLYGTNQLRFVLERQSVERLFNTFKSSLSLTGRCNIAALLVYLADHNQVSVAEVQESLTEAIDDPWSQQPLISSSKRADWQLKTSLLDLLFNASESLNFEGDIDMFNEVSDVRIPAAVFQRRLNK